MVPETCSVDGCDRARKARGYCLAHYKRFRRWGDPEARRPTRPAEDRFWEKVARRGPDECWPWQAAVMGTGYGAFHPAHGETVLAHRFSYALKHGEVPDGLHVDHTCHNGQSCPPGVCEHRLCCNPEHLDAVPSHVNVNRSHNSNAKKTHCPRGHKYTPENTRIHIKKNTRGRSCLECARDRDGRRSRKLTTGKAA